MDITLCPLFLDAASGYETIGDDGPALFSAVDQLDAFARSHKLRSPKDFLSLNDADRHELQRLGLDTSELQEEKWFEPDQGVAALRALASALRAHTVAIADPTEVLEELERLAKELASCEPGIRFRLTLAT